MLQDNKMLKYFFSERLSTFEFLALWYITHLVITYSVWWILMCIPLSIIQILMTNKIAIQELEDQMSHSDKEDRNQ